ncbi:serine-rich adhesin for platelets [Onthophagus taurus]|uniref:serine-rich adhesin for platelets n=1 Tax=Onthophagus taurus TaxID=166361 RepID=UPI000C20C257|nr:uncharacterized protein LOC111428107 [Onthophagus taurus]
MEDLALSEWPGQPVDLNGSNPWLPAYGFQQPMTLLDKEDFLGHPDADLFLQGNASQHYAYLETIQEETSDDLRSDSDLSESRDSPVGWLATDSESGSVIRIHTLGQIESSSERELACPSKRRRQDLSSTLSDDDSIHESLSRSSSLIQFESLEKQCQDISSSSPSIFNNFFESERQIRKSNPELTKNEHNQEQPESDYFKTILKIDGNKNKASRDSLFYNGSVEDSNSGSDSTESEETFSKSMKTWRSFDGLKNKISFENLSEDSGYSDHIFQNNNKNKSNSNPNINKNIKKFKAYDFEMFQNRFSGNFGVSYQDLTILDKYEKVNKHSIRVGDHFKTQPAAAALNLEQEFIRPQSKYTSEPNLFTLSIPTSSSALTSSVPKDLNLTEKQFWENQQSIATKNFDLINLNIKKTMETKKKFKKKDKNNDLHYKREGSYLEAMKNTIDFSDNEENQQQNYKYIKEFDKKILKAISEQSFNEIILISSLTNENNQKRNVKSTPNLTVDFKNDYDDEKLKRNSFGGEQPRKSSLANKSTTSTSSDNDESKNLSFTRSFSGSTSSKGVHFCPIVSEVNWRDDSLSTEREDSSSLSSNVTFKDDKINRDDDVTPINEIVDDNEIKLIKPEPIRPNFNRFYSSSSQPELLSDMVQVGNAETINLRDKEYTFVPLRPRHSISQPNVSRRNSKNCHAGAEIERTYTDGDGVQYKHTVLSTHSTHSTSPSVYNNNTAAPTTKSTTSHVAISNGKEVEEPTATSAMEPIVAHRSSKKATKLGGFFSRLASFRFSSRNKNEKQHKKKIPIKTNPEESENQNLFATKPDYIYIPLKDPIENDQKPEEIVVDEKKLISKPPLPKCGPRVVGACVKRRPDMVVGAPATMLTGGRHTERDEGIDSSGGGPMEQPMGLIETDLDTEVTVITSGAHVKTRSLMNLGAEAPSSGLKAPQHTGRPHKSMEFLLDKQNLKVVEPPENELQKGERVMSEHQLRVQRSLQKLTVPDWYKQAEVPREGFLLKKSPCRETRWTGTNSKTTSLSSLGSNTQSPVILSPTPQNQPFVRWSTSKLNSTASSPCASTRSSFNARGHQPNGSISPSSSLRNSFSYRQPYLGWRSQERLNRPRTPAERLASSILNHSQGHNLNLNLSNEGESPEIQTSIKEVTSAIVHYVSGLKPDEEKEINEIGNDQHQRSRSVSPRGSQKLCWLESSFVGTRPLDSPRTPITLSESQSSTPIPPSSLRLELHTHNDFSALLNQETTVRPSPGSTTLEDVLDSLLGLPSSTRAPSPSLQVTASANTSPTREEGESRLSDHFRRCSEGNEPVSRPSSASRRVSFDSSPVLRCRYSRCGKMAMASTAEGQAFKNCHNCTYTYCSRSCRRAHWEKHRKTCLFSRVGSLCRQAIAAAKEKPETLRHLSIIARRGFLSQGSGAVKCFFPTPEVVEKFLKDGGLENLGELTYISWKDLLPSEMGTQLYTELVRMCKNYNPDSKLVLYVSVCVISEAPAAGAVKWERQLVSRCAKMRLSKEIQVNIPEKDSETLPETLILTSQPMINKNISTSQRNREISFGNIQKHLRQRGVSLRKHYPEVFQQLQTYVDGQLEKFKAVTVYPKDLITGKTFMCIIMPESDPENVEKLVKAGVRVRTVDILED